MGLEKYIGILTIDLQRKEACIGWVEDIYELKTGEDRCFNISEPDRDIELELETLLKRAIIQSVKLENNVLKIYLIDIF